MLKFKKVKEGEYWDNWKELLEATWRGLGWLVLFSILIIPACVACLFGYYSEDEDE